MPAPQRDTAHRHFFLFGAALLLLHCNDRVTHNDEPDIRSISFGFETTLQAWKDLGGGGERAHDSDIVITSHLSAEGERSCRFRVSPVSNVNGGTRAELTFDQHAVEGDTSRYRWSVFIPHNYPDVPLKDSTGAPNWQIMGQWHQQPVFLDGEDWDNYSAKGASPPIALYYNYFTKADPHYRAVRTDTAFTSIHGFDTAWNNVSTFTVSYAEEPVAVFIIDKGEWIELRFQIVWSQGSNGEMCVWKNDTVVTPGWVNGANMYNRASHYFKFGLYRNPHIDTVQHLYYDDIRIW